MIPTKVRDLIPPAAEHIGIPEEHLTKMMSFYFKENKKHLSNLDNLHIILRGLGTMNLKGWQLQRCIFETEEKITSTTEDELQDLQRHLESYRRANAEWLSEEEHKKRVKELKKQYYSNKNDNNDSQGEDTTCVEE